MKFSSTYFKRANENQVPKVSVNMINSAKKKEAKPPKERAKKYLYNQSKIYLELLKLHKKKKILIL